MTLKETTTLLRQSGIDSAEYDARELMRHFGNIDAHLITQSTSCDSNAFIQAVARRANREPLQYIIGEVCFYREYYTVSPECLIPRSDTEILVDYAVKNIPEGEIFADLCCGSGCIGISTLANTKNTRCISVDISDGALELTRINAFKNNVIDRTEIRKSDLLNEGIVTEKPLFAILSNPPYIESAVYETLADEIFHEPKIAFVGGDDGMIFYERLIPIGLSLIKEDGFLAFEIGYDQADKIHTLAELNGCTCHIIKDYSGNDRVAVIRKSI